MCGINGIFDPRNSASRDDLLALTRRMADAIAHRGPDDHGAWADADAGIALGHRRLSIIDLSPAGHQPMASACGRYLIAFNGEVYNFADIRRELETEPGAQPLAWRGHSDTEVMLAAIARWGLEAALGRFVGMFAFALWDREARTLHLARDRLGIKPLYYGWAGAALVFGSELKALRAHPAFDATLERSALARFLQSGYVPAPMSIYRRAFKLPAGCIASVSAADCGPQSAALRSRAYWSVAEVARRGVARPFAGTDSEAVEELDRRLRDAVRLRMIADVPLGAFLSGGIDSSAVVALMQAQSDRPVRTFTIGFHEASHNEAEHAKAVAKHLGTEHTELYLTPQEAMAVIPRLPRMYDEPFADSSQIPTFLVSELTRRHVTVSLSGDGGDELFGGYSRYRSNRALWNRMRRVPRAVRGLVSGAVRRTPGWLLDAGFAPLRPLLRRYGYQDGRVSSGIRWVADVLDADSREALYARQLSLWRDPPLATAGGGAPDSGVADPLDAPDELSWMMLRDAQAYLPDDILAKVDRASMAVALEARVPLLDHRVVEFAWQLPLALKVRDGRSKWILRQVLDRYVPNALIERPKMGFGVPIGEWLRGPLRGWAEDLLSETGLAADGFLDPAPIRHRWAEHLAGGRNWQYELWAVLMFQQWRAQDKAA